MDTVATPLQVASLIARNLVPVAGLVFLDWSAPDLLVLYFVDTVLSIASLLLLVAVYLTGIGPVKRTRPFGGGMDWVRVAALVGHRRHISVQFCRAHPDKPKTASIGGKSPHPSG